MTKADSKAIAKQLIQITSKEARYLLRTVARLDALRIDISWVESIESWVEICELRNRLVHEYMATADGLLEALQQALQNVPILIES